MTMVMITNTGNNDDTNTSVSVEIQGHAFFKMSLGFNTDDPFSLCLLLLPLLNISAHLTFRTRIHLSLDI